MQDDLSAAMAQALLLSHEGARNIHALSDWSKMQLPKWRWVMSTMLMCEQLCELEVSEKLGGGIHCECSRSRAGDEERL